MAHSHDRESKQVAIWLPPWLHEARNQTLTIGFLQQIVQGAGEAEALPEVL